MIWIENPINFDEESDKNEHHAARVMVWPARQVRDKRLQLPACTSIQLHPFIFQADEFLLRDTVSGWTTRGSLSDVCSDCIKGSSVEVSATNSSIHIYGVNASVSSAGENNGNDPVLCHCFALQGWIGPGTRLGEWSEFWMKRSPEVGSSCEWICQRHLRVIWELVRPCHLWGEYVHVIYPYRHTSSCRRL